MPAACGRSLASALGDKKGIVRYGFCLLPMDEARVDVALDLSGRPCLVYMVDAGAEKVGEFDTCLAQEFFQAFSNAAGINLHIEQRAGKNPHHILEAVFKAVGRALRMAIALDPREKDFGFGREARFVDLETQEEVLTQPWHIKRAYESLMAEMMDRYQRGCRESRIEYAAMDSSQDFGSALLRYLAKRKRLG